MTIFENYVKNPENPIVCAAVALWYEGQGHLGPALSFYLRAAEFGTNTAHTYACLLKGALCYDKQGGRGNSVRVMLQNAIALIPTRPEAHFLLARFHERRAEWQEAYTSACIGLGVLRSGIKYNPIDYWIEYPGEYVLYFEKAVAAYWIGRGQESRELFRFLADKYWNVMDDSHKASVENNMSRLGSGPESTAFVPFNPENKFRYKFSGYYNIKQNYSQVMQDMFVLCMTDGQVNGTFVEIGAADPFKGNNTALLEKQFGWKGIAVEYDEKFIENYSSNRSTRLYHDDALTLDYKKLFDRNFKDTNIIDYLQLDIEPSRKTLQCLKMMPFDDYKFRVITFEHDYYVDPVREVREESREFLRSKGYVLVVHDVSPDGVCNFEDWWVHPDYVRPEILEIMQQEFNDKVTDIRYYMTYNNPMKTPEEYKEELVEEYEVEEEHVLFDGQQLDMYVK